MPYLLQKNESCNFFYHRVMKLKFEFSGGSELLVGKQRSIQSELPDGKWNLKSVIAWVKDNLVTERPDLLVQGDTV